MLPFPLAAQRGCEVAFIRDGPSVRHRPDLRACTARGPRDLASSAHKLPCGVRDELCGIFGGSGLAKLVVEASST
jgi:hypothetical protein